MSRGLGTEQRGVLAAMVRDTTRYWRRADIQRSAWLETMPGSDRQVLLSAEDFTEGALTRVLSSLVKRGLLERGQHSSGHLTWKVTQAGIDEASGFVPAAVINELANGAA